MFKDCQTDSLKNSIWFADRVVNIPSSAIVPGYRKGGAHDREVRRKGKTKNYDWKNYKIINKLCINIFLNE